MKKQTVLIIIVASMVVTCTCVYYFGFRDYRHETEENYIIEGIEGTFTINNPLGITRIFPSPDDKIYLQVNKFSNLPTFFKKEKGIPEIDVVFNKEQKNLDILVKYKSKMFLHTDMFIFCPELVLLKVISEKGNVWIEKVTSDVDIKGAGNKQEITIHDIRGNLKIDADSKYIMVSMADNRELILNSGGLVARVLFNGKFPGRSTLTGDGGQTIVQAALDANVVFKFSTKGFLFSNMTPELWKMGKIKSDGKTLMTTLGKDGKTVIVKQTDGEIIFDHQAPLAVIGTKPTIPFEPDEARRL